MQKEKDLDLGVEFTVQGWADMELKSSCRQDERNLGTYKQSLTLAKGKVWDPPQIVSFRDGLIFQYSRSSTDN